MTLKEQVTLVPIPSLAVYVTWLDPTANVDPGWTEGVRVTLAIEELLAVGLSQVATLLGCPWAVLMLMLSGQVSKIALPTSGQSKQISIF